MNLVSLRSSINSLGWSEGLSVGGKRDVGSVKLGRKFGCPVSSSHFSRISGRKGTALNCFNGRCLY